MTRRRPYPKLCKDEFIKGKGLQKRESCNLEEENPKGNKEICYCRKEKEMMDGEQIMKETSRLREIEMKEAVEKKS